MSGAALGGGEVWPDGAAYRRCWIVGLCVFAAILGLLGWIAYLQIVCYPELAHDERLAEEDKQRVKIPVLYPTSHEQPAKLGDIYDRDGLPLATTVHGYAINVDPAIFRRSAGSRKRAVQLARELARILGEEPDRVVSQVLSKRDWACLSKWIEASRYETLVQFCRLNKIKGIRAYWQRRRYYPLGPLFCHVIGWRNFELVPRALLELQWDFALSGRPGWWDCPVDAWGRPVNTNSRHVPPWDGLSLRLTVDADVQRAVKRALKELWAKHTPRMCQAVVLDVRTGAILAMAMLPEFDPNDHTGLHGEKARPKPTDYSCAPVQFGFEPGSVLKTITIAIALDAGVVSERSRFYCRGIEIVGGKPLRCSGGAHGALDLAGVLIKSCNISASHIGRELGAKRLVEGLHRFGFGQRLYVGLPAELRYSLPNPEKLRVRDVANMSFGQGVLVSLVQLAAAYAAIANGGVYMRPYLVDAVLNPDGSIYRRVEPQAVRRCCSPETSRRLLRMLELVVERGTGRRARIEGVRVGGKTGTAQKALPGKGYSDRLFCASFVMLVPADQPRWVVAVMADEPHNGHQGGVVAAPAARQIAEELLRRAGMLPTLSRHGGTGRASG